jgi:hypothetical protein
VHLLAASTLSKDIIDMGVGNVPHPEVSLRQFTARALQISIEISFFLGNESLYLTGRRLCLLHLPQDRAVELLPAITSRISNYLAGGCV